MRAPRLSLLALSIAATHAFAQTTNASPAPDYTNPQAWLCRPDRPGACDVDLSTTVVGQDGRATVERARLDPKAPVDCFYVYPTVSTDTTTVSDLLPNESERNVVRLQTGYLYHYAFAMLIGAAAFITWFMFSAGIH